MKIKYKKVLSFLLVLLILLNTCFILNPYAATGDLGEGYNVNNIDFTFTTVDGESVSTNSNGKVKVILFARTNGNCSNSNTAISTLCNIGWTTLPEVEVLIVDIDKYDASAVKAVAESYDAFMIKFCYDETDASANMLWKYLAATKGSANTVTLPVTVIIDQNNKVQYCNTGYTTATEIYKYVDLLLNGGEAEDEEDEITGGKDLIQIYTEGSYDYDSAEEVFRLTNEARVNEGKSKLVMDEKLTELAMYRAAEQALVYDHTRPNGTKWYTLLTGKYLSGAAENIAWGQYSAASATTAWLNSAGHYANIMNDSYTSIGVGSYVHNGTRYWVQLFSSYSQETYTDKGLVTKSVVIEAMPENTGAFSLLFYDYELNPGETTVATMYLANLTIGSTRLTVKPDNVKFKSSDDSIATVDSKGVVTAISPGKAKITAILDETLIAKAEIEVVAATTDTPVPTHSSDLGLMGDVNSDKSVDAQDALMVLKHAAKLEIINSEDLSVADVYHDGNIDASDALLILKIAAKLV